jgi:hypothetical protein
MTDATSEWMHVTEGWYSWLECVRMVQPALIRQRNTMNRCVYCQGRVLPLVGRCQQCHRRQPSARALQSERGEVPGEVLPHAEQEEAQPSEEVHQSRPEHLPQRRLSRRTLLKVAGTLGVGVGVGVAGREVYLLAQNHPLLTYRGHNAQIQALAWSPDSQWIASTSGAEVQLWEALSGRLLRLFPYQQGFESVAWSPDGQYLATGSWDRTISVWQVVTGHKVLTYRGHVQEQSFADTPQAGLAKQAEQIMLLPSSRGFPGIESLEWSPDGTRLISTANFGRTQVWEALTGKTLLRFDSQSEYYGAGMWSPNGQYLLMYTIRGIERHVATTGALESSFSIGDDGVNGPFALSPDGRWLATDAYAFVVHLWDVKTGRQTLTYQGHSKPVTIFAWSPDSRIVASAGVDMSVRVWKASDGQTEYIYRGHMNPFQLFFQGGLLPGTADASRSRSSHNTAAVAPLLKSGSALLPQDTGGGQPMGIRALAWAPNGRYIASGGSDNTVQVWQPG